jgi:hypothetical protein
MIFIPRAARVAHRRRLPADRQWCASLGPTLAAFIGVGHVSRRVPSRHMTTCHTQDSYLSKRHSDECGLANRRRAKDLDPDHGRSAALAR